jgi:hypothetical protein
VFFKCRTYNLASSTDPPTSAATFNPIISPENFVATVRRSYPYFVALVAGRAFFHGSMLA